MKKIVGLLVALIMVMSLVACGGSGDAAGSGDGDGGASAEPITLRVAVQSNEDHETCKAVRRVAEKVEQETDGGLILEIYSDSALGDYSAVFDEVRQGTIDIAVQSISGEYDPALEVFYLPYLFTNYEESAKVLSEGSNTYKLIQDKFDSYGMVYMGCYVEGFVQVASNTFIDNMADPAAKKDVLIRCPAIESGRLQMDCQNFPTVTIPYADLYTSLQTKVCDGWMGGTAELNYVSFRDVIKYLYGVNCQMENNSAFMNKEAYEALPEDYQKILYDAFTEEAALSFDRAEATDTDNIQKLKDYGVEVVTYTQDELNTIADWVRDKTWDKDFEMMGDDVKDAVYADMGW